MNNIFNDNSYDENVLKQIFPQVNSLKESVIFVSFLLSNMPNLQQLKTNTTTDEIKVCLSFISVLNLCQTPEQRTMICNSVLDQVRSENTK
ncbi:nuclear-transcribed mRNA catabolic process, deadenylation-dependent decay [Trichomonas vaginalis G3]|uniref:nuclear-transcribed mRNA catabolic process, deadenylation-dependent decay n=1 Tax=Trichomonas vaginalis (strain ATCC PRA-98 / G3) TaxID=412133 RepID=UPI0021E59EF6|nr:nuclear-transcribed mRNA catabolic process, deadenylation-dependent decay [Trichomonas vaginalis G3]KAI5498078.1 nuclear-transcribed mRNA catabolic process, deadenylation-dependent decay [Trichomonas vaginalis G3]